MNDRELLELAAKACGYNTAHKWNRERLQMVPPVIALVVHDENDELFHTAWSPLADDAAALRLAVKLAFEVYVHETETRVISGNLISASESHEQDAYAATRRAIVRVAAAIGEDMP